MTPLDVGSPLLTDEFLATLVRAARTIGWEVDFVEVAEFVHAVYRLAGKPEPTRDEMEPFE